MGDGNAFGAWLRELRERTRPEEIGLPAGIRRKVKGLRREELAAFSDLSADYITRLEQGHVRNPSPEVVTALGRAMRLPRLELELLHQLAGHTAPSDLEVPQHIAPGVRRIIDRLGDVPVASYDATWTLLLANPAWRALNGIAMSTPGFNLVRAAFTGRPLGHEEDRDSRERLQRSLIADLRIAAARYPADQGMQHLLRELLDQNALFPAYWSEGLAQPFLTEAKRMSHPALGDFWLDCDVLTAPDGDTRIVFYTAAHGSPGQHALTEIVKEPAGPGDQSHR